MASDDHVRADQTLNLGQIDHECGMTAKKAVRQELLFKRTDRA